MKTCKRCGETRALAEFHKHPRTGDRRQPYCKECANAARKAWDKQNPERVKRNSRRGWLRNEYGLTEAAFEAMRVAQNNCCASCGDPFTETPRVDHCHTTGKVRALLCNGCNIAIGHAKEDPVRCVRMAAYLILHQSTQRRNTD